MPYTNEQKLQYECEKLEKEVEKLKVEVKNIKRPYFLQPSTIWAAIPLFISIMINLGQCSSSKREKQMADIQLAQTKYDLKMIGYEKDSLEKRKTELADNIALAQSQLNTVLDSTQKIKELAVQLTNSMPASPTTEKIIEHIQQTVRGIDTAGKYAVANIDMKSSTFRVSKERNMTLAKQKWENGFDALVKNDIEAAINSFTASENACNGYHHAYELARYLRSKANIAADPEGRKEIIRTVLGKYSGFAPPESITALKKELNG